MTATVTKMPAAKVQREAVLDWVPIQDMKVSAVAQRELRPERVAYLVANFDLEALGTPTCNLRSETWYVIDGQHRVETLRQIGYGDQQVECWTYRGLTEEEEAKKFLQLNNELTVGAFPKFAVGVTARLPEESEISRIVRECGLRISTARSDGSVSAVKTLRRVYAKGGAACLAQALIICRDAYGQPGLEGSVVGGIGLLCFRYGLMLDPEKATLALSTAAGGVQGLLGKADVIRRQTGSPKEHCIAAAAVELINRGRGGVKLPNWWRADAVFEFPQAG